MIVRQPYLPRFMAGGETNPLGARALYLGKTVYRIHGTNQPSTIGTFVSSGCIRLTNEDVMDLYSRVKVGTRVVVLAGKPPPTAAATPPVPAAAVAPPAAVMASPLAPPPSAMPGELRGGGALVPRGYDHGGRRLLRDRRGQHVPGVAAVRAISWPAERLLVQLTGQGHPSRDQQDHGEARHTSQADIGVA
jgi:hypothetical protein